MTRALLCSVLLLSLSCSSGSSDAGGSTGGMGNSSGSGNQSGGSSGSVGSSGSANNGGSGNGGSAGVGTTAGGGGSGATAGGAAGGDTAGAGGTSVSSNASVTQWGGDIARTSHWVHPSLTKANMAKMALDTFTAPAGTAEYAGKFAGEIAATPLYIAGATAGAGEYIIETTQNDVYAFNEGTGALVWKHNLGAFLGKGGSVCGSPNNHGIVSTPVIDLAARVIYVTAGMTDGHYELHALSADTGMEVAGGWPFDFSKVTAPGVTQFPSTVQIQRSALSLVGGIVYVAFGGFCGDGGNYHGWVVGVNSKDPTKSGAWATMDEKAGIWAPGGMASDGNGVFAVTGNNGASGDHSTSDSEEVIRVTGLGVGMRDDKNMFFPTEWATPMNAKDLDFGSSSPAVVSVPASTPSKIIVAPSKNGRVYFLDSANLGASLGQFADMAVAGTNAASVYTAPSAYTTTSGVHVAITTGEGSQCPGATNNGSVMSILLQPGATPDKAPTPKIAWCGAIKTDGTTKRSPTSTNSSGTADPIVWLVNGSTLNGFDGETGAVVYDGGTTSCGGVPYFSQAIVANGHIVTAGAAAGQAHLCSWSVHN